MSLRTQRPPPPPPNQDLPPLVDNLPPAEPVPPVVIELPVVDVPDKWDRGQDTVIYTPPFIFGPPEPDDGLVSIIDLMPITGTGPLPAY
jgi:hypothetical protein